MILWPVFSLSFRPLLVKYGFNELLGARKNAARDAPTTNQKSDLWSRDWVYLGLTGLPVTPSNLAFLINLCDSEYRMLILKIFFSVHLCFLA